jgi:hypothetical protein
MPAKIRVGMIWCVPAVVFASWLVVRALGASPAPFPAATTALASERTEIGDPSLRALIGQFAEAARSAKGGSP